MECPTVRIKSANNDYPFTVINESDFDPAKHELYVADEAPAPAIAPEGAAPAKASGKKGGK